MPEPLRRMCLLLASLLLPLAAMADSTSLLAQARSQDASRHDALVAQGAEITATSDRQSFTVWWQPPGWTPVAGIIVALHGHAAYATSEAFLWQPFAEKHGHAVLALQWWFGGGDATSDYYRPEQIVPLVSALLTSKGARTGSVLFTGFSRGSANSYAVAALDHAGSGRRFFGLVLSNAGGAASGYPPNLQIAAGAFGSQPFAGLAWAMYCGEKDPDPTINGCPAMTSARDWVTKYGASVQLFIDDPAGEHGGFMLDSRNVETALATYAGVLARREVDCLLDWAEDNFPTTFQPRRSPSMTSAPYTYRYYAGPNVFLGVSSTDQHVWFVDAGGGLADLGLMAPWSVKAGCR